MEAHVKTNSRTAGAVVDLAVRETFDSTKIYVGLLLAVLLSLGTSLVYGFLMDRDFSTGFSIGSWILTAFGFFAAVVAAGEYLGLESPGGSFVVDVNPQGANVDLLECASECDEAVESTLVDFTAKAHPPLASFVSYRASTPSTPLANSSDLLTSSSFRTCWSRAKTSRTRGTTGRNPDYRPI